MQEKLVLLCPDHPIAPSLEDNRNGCLAIRRELMPKVRFRALVMSASAMLDVRELDTSQICCSNRRILTLVTIFCLLHGLQGLAETFVNKPFLTRRTFDYYKLNIIYYRVYIGVLTGVSLDNSYICYQSCS